MPMDLTTPMSAICMMRLQERNFSASDKFRDEPIENWWAMPCAAHHSAMEKVNSARGLSALELA